jgi:imidazolonepropionase-like amidohydrolase
VSLADLDALQPLLARQVPLAIRVDRAADIEAVLRFAKEQEIRLIIEGGAEAWLVADGLGAAKVPVVLDPYVNGPGSFDEVRGRADNAALLVAAGVPVALSTFQSHNARTLRQEAGNAVRAGLDHTQAIRAITEVPAAIYGLSDRGRLAAGAVADVAVWSGDPLELSTRLSHLVIDGREVSLETRQTRLLERYRTLPGTPLAPLSLP